MTSRFFVPEVVQSSGMDCGPAALKSLLEGHGIEVSYGRLREACQTDVDGTSIDAIEELAQELGLEAEQVVVPVDHLMLPESNSLPAVLVVRLPNGFLHFVVVWKRHGSWVQVMDPAVGRRWLPIKRLLSQVHVHRMEVPQDAWWEFAQGDEFRGCLAVRLEALGVAAPKKAAWSTAAMEDATGTRMMVLDAGTRMVRSLVEGGALSAGADAQNVLEAFLERGQTSLDESGIPGDYFSARPAEPDEDGDAQVEIRGAVLLSVRGVRSAEDLEPSEGQPASKVLLAALAEKATAPWREMWNAVRQDSALSMGVVALSALFMAAFVMVEALLLRGVFEVGGLLRVTEQRAMAAGALVVFLAALLLLELPISVGSRQIGRVLENRFRLAFLSKLPKLNDRYFRSRLMSDMAERSHSIQLIRALPRLVAQFLQALFGLCFTAAGIVWIEPSLLLPVAIATLFALVVPVVSHRVITDPDLEVRTHLGALSRFYLDALLGMIPIRAHTAEGAVRVEHEAMLVHWEKASLRRQRVVVALEGCVALTGFAIPLWLVLSYLDGGGVFGGVLLLVYWALSLPVYGQTMALVARQYPMLRNVLIRLLEPLGALEEQARAESDDGPNSQATPASGMKIELDHVAVVAGGHTILEDLSVVIEAGSHVAVVGPSGAGKSSLVGLLLGWHQAAAGEVRADGEVLAAGVLDRLRSETAWVDPEVQLWNGPLLANLAYGAPESAQSFSEVLHDAQLVQVVERLPLGLQSSLGEGGGALSGGEGQRVRLGRAFMRSSARLVILDEAFRGLDRVARRKLLLRARETWKDATLICVTHDIGETEDFDRVLVVEDGRLREHDSPRALLSRESRYRGLREAEEALHSRVWKGPRWRRMSLADGKLREAGR